MKINILAVGAHPDDVELSSSGTLMLHKDLGYTIGILDLTEGELGTRGSVETRYKESEIASEVMGLDFRGNLKLPDGFLNPYDTDQLMRLIDEIRRLRPDVVITNALEDRHPDHGNSCELVERACFMAGLPKIVTNHSAWRPKLVLNYIQDRYIKPHLVVDISAYWERKMESIRAYKTQFYDSSSQEPETYISTPEFLEYVMARNKDFGRFCGASYAEGFTTKRVLGIPDLMKLA